MKNRRLWICLALGLFLAASPILLMELTPQPGRQEGAADKVLSASSARVSWSRVRFSESITSVSSSWRRC
jgi:hypothetical protein